jgi:sialidase-1
MEERVLAVRGVGGYRQYRIPAMAVTPSGRIIAIYDGRFDFDDLPAPVDLVFRISDDNGSTWSAQSIFREHDGVYGFGDASIIIDPAIGDKGRILVLYQHTKLAGFFESKEGTDLSDPEISQIGLSYSDDDGKSWKHEYVTDQLKAAGTLGIFATSGMGGRITDGKFAGRLLQAFVLRTKTELFSQIGYSDDHGVTWSLGAVIPGGNETAITALHDGSILFHSRATPYRLAGRSIDGGLTLSDLAPDQALPDPSDNGSLTTLSNGDLICTHNHDSDLRMNTVIKESVDGGKTWHKGFVIEKGSSAYSTACELADGSIGILYERNAYVEIVFARIKPEELIPLGNLIYPLETKNKIEFEIVPRFIRPGRKGVEILAVDQLPQIPEVDMSLWRPSERKEIAAASGSASGDSLLTKAQLDQLMGEITTTLKVGDEIRVSGYLRNNTKTILQNVEIKNPSKVVIAKSDCINPDEKLCFLDYRHYVNSTDFTQGFISMEFEWWSEGLLCIRKAIRISTRDGLPISSA